MYLGHPTCRLHPSSFGTKDPANAGSSPVIAWGERQRANPSVKRAACATIELFRANPSVKREACATIELLRANPSVKRAA